MIAKRVQSWVVTDEFWMRVEPLIPARARVVCRTYARKPGVGRKAKADRRVFEAIVFVLRTGCQWKALLKTGLAAVAPSTSGSRNGVSVI